jgi:hypothetical protein
VQRDAEAATVAVAAAVGDEVLVNAVANGTTIPKVVAVSRSLRIIVP